MTPKMCKDQTDVAAFGYKTQNTSPNEIHSDVQITVFFLCIYAAACRGLVPTSGILGSLHVCMCPRAEQAASFGCRLGSSWVTLTYISGLTSTTLPQLWNQ